MKMLTELQGQTQTRTVWYLKFKMGQIGIYISHKGQMEKESQTQTNNGSSVMVDLNSLS